MWRPICLLTFFLLVTACANVPSAMQTPPSFTQTASPEKTSEDLGGAFREEWDKLIEEIKAQGIQNSDVLRAMRTVPRHKFVLPEYLDQAYENHPLPIGYGQTISQPFIVAWMTELLELQPGEKVLEIGTGSGYQAAVLAELGYVEIYSVEIIPELAERSAALLKELGYDEVRVKQGDGYYGWAEHAPFDAILVTAAPDHLPGPLVDQLAEGGRIVIPIGPPGWYQSLWKFVKENGDLKAYNLGGVMFVPLTGPGVETHHGEPPVP
ncbi:MAG TPA: protein-L-isoaspartate(D-aspartate) O-methyltransferase [Anaerolineales bacterium]|nr:protein-L-isoaspartate(D-aspartate) O-methyltransferase [Anaerolineales bacterium]